MSIKDCFLNEVRIGSYIEIVIAPKVIKGLVVLLDFSTVKLKKVDGKEVTISLDSIGCYEIFDNLPKEIVKTNESTSNISKSLYEKDIIDVPASVYTPVDFNAIESRGLLFETHFWNDDIKLLKIDSSIKNKIMILDSTGELINGLQAFLNKIANCVKINEFNPKFGRIQPILKGIDILCEKYNSDIFYELLALLLINTSMLYKEALNKICTNPIIRLSDAVVCFKNKKYQEMSYYCSEYFSSTELTENNFDNFLFSIIYLLSNGYNDVLNTKRQEIKKLSKAQQDLFGSFYNNAKSLLVLKNTNNSSSVIVDKESNKGNDEFNDVRKVQLNELKAKIDVLVHNSEFSQAYNIIDKKFKENPENEDLSELLHYVVRVKTNYNKFKNLPRDNSFYAKALREWHIFENIQSAKSNFLLSIDNKEDRYFSAIMDYVTLVMLVDGEDKAIEKLLSYKTVVSTLDSDSRIKYYEKLASLYQKDKDYLSLLQSLNSLKELYQVNIKRSISKPSKKKNKAKLAGTLFRISQCYYMLENYIKAIDLAYSSIENGHSLYACVNLIVSCYLSENKWDEARIVVNKYSVDDYNLLSLFDKINAFEEGYNQKFNDGEFNNGPVDVYELLGFNNEFISYYEKKCEFEGISEEKKISKEFTDNDLRIILNEIKYASKTKPKDCADYYLTATHIERELNGQSDAYYEFLSNSMLYRGHLLLANKDFDSAKSYYLTAISLSLINAKDTRIEKDAICNYMYAVLKQSKTQNVGEMIKFDSEMMSLASKLSEMINVDNNNSILYDIIRIINVSGKLKLFFEENSGKEFCKNILNAIMKFVNCNKVDKNLWETISVICKKAEYLFGKWETEVLLNKNLENEIEQSVTDVINSLLVTNIDVQYIKQYITCCNVIREYGEYSDFDNRIRVLNQGKNGLKELVSIGHEKSTLFFENHLMRIINITLDNINTIISRTGEDYKPELSIQVPITNIPFDNGYVSLSVTIINADNKATARNIYLTVLGLNDEELYKQRTKSNNLKGGAEISELLRIPIGVKEAFTLKIILSYEDDENLEYKIEKELSISTNVRDFEEIKNPYITGKPVVNEEMFFGRDLMVQRLASAICDDRIRCIIIYGQKRTGKSSIFDHLKRKLTDKFIVLNFSVGADITSEKNFYKSVKNELVNYLEDNEYCDDIIDFFDEYKIEEYSDFQQFIAKVNRKICSKESKELLLMIDEFTHIYTYINDEKYKMDETFMDKWKAMIEKNLFKSALIGQDFMLDFIEKYANQFQVTDPVLVSYLERKDAIDLVVKPILMIDGGNRFLEKSEEMIVDWFNGQPYYLQTYCSRLVDYINEEQKQNYITAAIAKIVKDSMLSNVKLDFFDNLVRANEIELLEVLLKIAQASDIPGAKVRVDRLNTDEEFVHSLEKLNIRGVIDYAKAEKKCSIKIPFFHEWLRYSY